MRSIRLTAVLALTVIAASCSSPSTGPFEGSTTTVSNVGGEAEPVQRPSEDYPHNAQPIEGTIDRHADGCWTIDIGEGSIVAIFPSGTETTQLPASVVTSAGTEIPSGERIVGTGGTLAASDLPGAPDGFWSNYLAFCDPSASRVFVIDALSPVPDLSDDELVAMLASAVVSESWPCGLGFTMSDVDQTVVVAIYPTNADAPVAPPIDLPDPTWEARVVLGSDLLVNHCDDVVEPTEPVRVELANWPIIEGTIDFDPPEERCGGAAEVVATLRGLVVDGPSGPIALPDLEAVNTAYGCFAG